MKETHKGLIDILIPLVIAILLTVFLVYDIKCGACVTQHIEGN